MDSGTHNSAARVALRRRLRAPPQCWPACWALLAAIASWMPAALAQQAQLQLEVTGLDGQIIAGQPVQFAPDLALQTSTGLASLSWSEVLSVRPAAGGSATQPVPAEFPLRFCLADGSLFGAVVAEAAEDGFIVRYAAQRTCRLDLSLLRWIEARFGPSAAREKFREVLASAGPAGTGATAADARDLTDVAVVGRAQEVLVLRGRTKQIGPDGVRFEWSGREVLLPWERLGGLTFARPAPRTAACLVRLQGGEAFAGRVVGGSESSLRLHSPIFEELELPWSRIDRIDCRSERLVVLSDLQPARYEFEPFFDKTWDYALDRTLTGRPIRLGRRQYARGVTMHSRAALTYRLDGGFEQFAATAGILDEMGPRGCVTLRIIADGRALWEAAGVRGGQPPRDVLVDVTGVQELTLMVDYDEELDLSDQAAWGFARLIR